MLPHVLDAQKRVPPFILRISSTSPAGRWVQVGGHSPPLQFFEQSLASPCPRAVD
jgi:hypothetical protein